MRLIDADELKKKFQERSYWTYTHEYGDAIPIGWIMSGIDHAPTVEERPHGKWIYVCCYGDEYPQCSVCGEINDVKTNFCPDCGADMRGEENGK